MENLTGMATVAKAHWQLQKKEDGVGMFGGYLLDRMRCLLISDVTVAYWQVFIA